MLEVKYEGKIAVIDLREHIRKGEHPKKEIIDFMQQAAVGTVVELHLPHRAAPLVAALESVGIPAVVNELEPEHFRLMCVKM